MLTPLEDDCTYDGVAPRPTAAAINAAYAARLRLAMHETLPLFSSRT